MSDAAPSFQDIYDVSLAELLIRRSDLQVLQGDVTDAMLCGIAAAGDADVRQAVIEFAATFLDSASGDRLTKLADDRYNQQRFVATGAIGTVRISRTSGGSAETLIAGTRVATQPDASGLQVVFTLDAPAAFGGGSNGPISVAATAQTTGRESNAAAAAISVFVDQPTDSTFVVTNLAGFAGGAAEETDEALRARCRAFFATLRRGTLAALEFGAKQVAQVRVATASEASSGLVTLYVSDEDGNSNAEMINDVIIELENWRAGGAVIQVLGGVIYEQDVTLSITARVGVAVDATVVTAAVVGALKKLRTGETLYLTTIRSAVKAIDPDGVTEVVVTNPPTNVVPSGNQLIRCGAVTIV